MRTRQRISFLSFGLFLLFSTAATYLAPTARMQKGSAKPSMQINGGLNVATFDTNNGKVIVNLPDDMMAGDTISGTVVAEPKGNSDAERAQNLAELSGYVVELKAPKKAGKPTTVSVPVKDVAGALVIFVGEGDSSFPDAKQSQNTIEVALRKNPGTGVPTNKPGDFAPPQGTILVSTTDINFAPPQGNIIVAEPNRFRIPPMGQQGRPIEIPGPFDGDSANTQLHAGDRDLPILAESPRKAVFRAPTNTSGPMELTLNERGKETKGTFRNIGVNLSAPKTNLMKGESTTVTVRVEGLQGIPGAVPLHLTKGGVVTMQGGDNQTMMIQPSDVQANGTYTTTRTITGQQAGVFNVTATVVVFRMCLQDDHNGNVLIFNAETGDFAFCQGRSSLVGANPIALTTMNFGDSTQIPRLCEFYYGVGAAFSGGAIPIGPGKSTLTKNGTFVAADFYFSAGQLHVELNGGDYTGSASGFAYQQITVPSNATATRKKIDFTIHDSDTRNNTCTCR